MNPEFPVSRLYYKSCDNLLQRDLNDFSAFTRAKQLKINIKKSTVMLFNVSRTLDFPPDLNVGSEYLEVVPRVQDSGI